jgi:hypothetical protein
MKNASKAVAVSVVVVFGIAVTTLSSAQQRLTVATGPTGGVYYPLGGAVAKVLGASIPNATATHEATSASADNIRQIASGKADVAFTQADTAWDGFKGYAAFGGQPQPIRTVAVLYPNNLHVVTLQGNGINRVSDLRGKRVSTGPAKSGTEIWGERLLLANGIDPNKDITRSSLGPAESGKALAEGKLDAFIWSGGVPTKAIADLAKVAKIRLLDSAAAVPNMLRKHGPVYTDGEIAANAYEGVGKSRVAQVWNLLIVKDSMDDKLVQSITKALHENKAELVAGHKEAENLDLKLQARGGSPIPFHAGAKRFYLEKGVRILR